MTIPARRDPAAEALQLAAIRMQEGPYRGFDIFHHFQTKRWFWEDQQAPATNYGSAPTQPAARRAVDELLSKETRV